MAKIDTTSAIFSGISEEIAQEFVEHRKLLKKPLTQAAFDRAMKAAVRCEALGVTASQVIELTIDKGWQGVVYEYVAAELARRFDAVSSTVRPTRSKSLIEDLTDRSWAN